MSKIHFAKNTTENWVAGKYLTENLDTAVDFWTCRAERKADNIFEVIYTISWNYIDFTGKIAEEINQVSLFTNNSGLYEELSSDNQKVVDRAGIEFLQFHIGLITHNLKKIIKQVGDGSF